MDDSKTTRAIRRVDNGEKPYAAAKAEGLSPNTLYVALKRRRDRDTQTICPCCGQPIRKQSIPVLTRAI